MTFDSFSHSVEAPSCRSMRVKKNKNEERGLGIKHRSSCFFREILVSYDMNDKLVLENVALFAFSFVVRVCF